MEACLRTKTDYVDATGEVDVFEMAFKLDARARDRGIVLMPGVGFDVVPTDCAAKYVSERLPTATKLEIALAIDGPTSGGTAATAVESIPAGALVRRDGQLVSQRAGVGARRVHIGGHERTVVPMTWGDLATAHRSTGIDNITVYMASSTALVWVLRLFVPLTGWLLRSAPLRHRLRRMVRWLIGEPEDDIDTHVIDGPAPALPF